MSEGEFLAEVSGPKVYAQRASAGLIIAEATAISAEGFGWADTPGLWSEEQVGGWRRVTDTVHAAGGRIIAQLWHTEAISHPELRDGLQPVSASDVDPLQISVTPSGRKPTVRPRPLSKQEIQATVADFGRTARHALSASFDGVQILANYLYLISQFLNAATNLRKDELTRLFRLPHVPTNTTNNWLTRTETTTCAKQIVGGSDV